jgi:hypothetical protein
MEATAAKKAIKCAGLTDSQVIFRFASPGSQSIPAHNWHTREPKRTICAVDEEQLSPTSHKPVYQY